MERRKIPFAVPVERVIPGEGVGSAGLQGSSSGGVLDAHPCDPPNTGTAPQAVHCRHSIGHCEHKPIGVPYAPSSSAKRADRHVVTGGIFSALSGRGVNSRVA